MSRFIHATFVLLVILSAISYVGELYAQDGRDIQIENPMEMASGEYEILEVSVSGISPDRNSYLINQSGLTVGSVIRIPGEAVPDAIHRLYQTGLYSDVEIRTEQVAGGLHVEIIVQEQPRLERYILEGVKRSDRRDLRDRLNLISGFAVKNSDRAQAVNTIMRYFREEGYWNTTVEIEEERTDDLRNRVTLTFNIDPGERIKVRRIQFTGIDNFSERKLKRQLDTIKEDTWWRIFKKHVFTREDFEEAKQNLIDFYRENGHRDVRVVSDSVYTYDFRRGKQGVSVDMEIHEGPQYKVRNIEWDGNSVYSDERLTQALGFQKGEVFNERKFRENLEQSREEGDVTSLYHNVGYLFFQVYEDIRVVAEDSLDLHFDIIENDIATIEDVAFSGNNKTHDDVVRRVLRTVPGQTYSRSAIIRSIRELSTLGYFNPEGIEPNLNPNPEENTVDINYQLDESQSTDNFEFSGGFGGRQIGVILAARVNFNNFSVQRMFEPGGWRPIPSGDGQKLSLGVQVTGRGYQSYSFSFQEPWLGGKPTSFGVSMSYDILNYGRFSTRSTGERNELFSSSVSIGRQLKWPDDYFSQSTSVRYQLYNIAGSDGIFGDGKTNIISVRHKIERNSLDNFISPTRGSQMHITGEVAPPLPNFGQYFKIKTGYHHHNTLVGRLVLSASADYGYMGYFGSGTRSNFQRFFLGGTAIQQRQSFINDNIDMRGFPGGTTGVISPVDENRNLVGGRVYSKYTMELRYPAVTSEQVQLIPYVFMDAGNTYLDLDSFDPFNLKRAAGVGARIYLPILGLVDLSYGYRMDGTPASVRGNGLQAGEWEFLFNMGAPF